MDSVALRSFRAALRACFGRCADAPFELCDAALTSGFVPSPVHPSLAPVHRRGWCGRKTGEACGLTETRSSASRWANHSVVMMETMEALEAWWECE